MIGLELGLVKAGRRTGLALVTGLRVGRLEAVKGIFKMVSDGVRVRVSADRLRISGDRVKVSEGGGL
jgi:hypothetical protein